MRARFSARRALRTTSSHRSSSRRGFVISATPAVLPPRKNRVVVTGLFTMDNLSTRPPPERRRQRARAPVADGAPVGGVPHDRRGEAAMKSKHIGSSVRSFFEERGEWEEVQARAQKKIIAEVFRRKMEKDRITKAELAKRMATSRSQLDAILNAEEAGLTLTSIMRICAALGLQPNFRFAETRKAG